MPLGVFAPVEGVAAGAMLTMSTLLGVLAAIFFKTLE